MPFHLPGTSTLHRGLRVCIEDLEVRFRPVVLPKPGNGGFLRFVRRTSTACAILLVLSFSLYCTQPQAALSTGRSETGAEKAASPESPAAYDETGDASWYGFGDGFAGRPTASGESFDPEQLTCAHRTLPLGTMLEVKNMLNGRQVLLRVNDRGPYAHGRILDVSFRAARELDMVARGSAPVHIRTVEPLGRLVPAHIETPARNPYTIQIAALRDPENIERLTRALKAESAAVFLQQAVDHEGQVIQRIHVGEYQTQADAEKALDELLKRLKFQGVEPFITRRR